MNSTHDKSSPQKPATRTRGYLRFKRSKKALVLEDDRVTCWMIARTLRKSGWEVTVTGGMNEAMNLTDESLEIAFVDINLPDGNGLKFIEFLAEAAPEAKVIVCTADNASEVAMQALEAGAYEFLVKPLEPSKIITTSRQALSS